MAGYPKIWTTILGEEWYRAMNCQQRGVLYQLYMIAKVYGDTGIFSFSSCSHLAHELSISRSTLANILWKFQQLPVIRLATSDSYAITIEVLNYKEWNSLTPSGVHEKLLKFPHPSKQPEQSKPEQSIPAVDRFRKWWKENEPKIREICTLNGWDYDAVWKEGPAMATWVTTNPHKGNKNNWGGFVANWMRRKYAARTTKVMSATEESDHYANHRRNGGNEGGPLLIGDMIQKLMPTDTRSAPPYRHTSRRPSDGK